MKEMSLYDRIGGAAAINKAVDIIYTKIINDPELSPFFDNINMRKQKAKKRMFMMMVCDGPIRYSSKDLSTAHSPIVMAGLNKNHFSLFLNHLIDTLNELELNERDKKEIINRYKGLQNEVLKGISYPPLRRSSTVSSFKEYTEVTSQFSENTLYRGQANVEWPLVPSLARLTGFGSKLNLERIGGWKKLEKEIMKRFIRHSRPFLRIIPETYIEWLVLAQHHGLPTRLLDWTQNPLVALYFALSTNSSSESVIWVMEPKYVFSVDIDLTNLEALQVYFPVNIDEKLVAQKGCFTVQPLPDDNSDFIALQDDTQALEAGVHSITKIIIPDNNNLKSEILLELANCGVDENFIYPDLYGLCRQIKNDVQNNIFRF